MVVVEVRTQDIEEELEDVLSLSDEDIGAVIKSKSKDPSKVTFEPSKPKFEKSTNFRRWKWKTKRKQVY